MFSNLEWPLIQAPMAGGANTPELIAAVANAGALGSLGAAYLSPSEIVQTVGRIRELTDRPLNANLFAVATPSRPAETAAALRFMAPFHEELGLGPPAIAIPDIPFRDQAETLLEMGVAVFSFTMGMPDRKMVSAFQAKGTQVVGTATTVAEGEALQAAGVDAIVAQGSEAGGHRGTFLTSSDQALVPTLELCKALVSAVKLPVIASGGIMDGADIRAAMSTGAAGVQLGTAFLTCPESGIPECHKQAILTCAVDNSQLTTAFSGRAARGIRNRFLLAGESHPEAILPFPWQNSLTRPMRNAAAKAGKPEFLSLWAGQAANRARSLPAAQLVEALVREAGWRKT